MKIDYYDVKLMEAVESSWISLKNFEELRSWRVLLVRQYEDFWQFLCKNFALGRFGFVQQVCSDFGAAENVRKALFPKHDADDDDRNDAEDSEQNGERDFNFFRLKNSSVLSSKADELTYSFVNSHRAKHCSCAPAQGTRCKRRCVWSLCNRL